MPRNTLVIVVGLTGVGKTSVIDTAADGCSVPIQTLSYGSLLLEEAEQLGLVDDRDELTELDPDEYDKLQQTVAETVDNIVSSADDNTVYVLDTHAALNTPFGYRPGLPQDDVRTMNPDQLIYIRATPSEIRDRRAGDESRNRDRASVEQLTEHHEIAQQMATMFSAVTRAPLALIDNPDGALEDTANDVVPLFEREA